MDSTPPDQLDGSSITDEGLETLTQLSNLLHLFHHRNKNQHRHSIWWRQFSLFRKNVIRLHSSLTSLNETPQTHLARLRKKVNDERVRQRIRDQLAFWQDVLLSRWHHAFSQLLADGRFAVMGVVLMAVLADVCRTVGITQRLENVWRFEDDRRVVRHFAKQLDGRPRENDSNGRQQGEDVGETISRPMDSESDVETPAPAPAATTKAAARSSPLQSLSLPKRVKKSGKDAPLRKKKVRKGNAIDDLFSSLG